jgi:hypothetical protein
MIRTNKTLSAVSAILASATLLGASAQAAVIWNGGTANWESTNWSTSAQPLTSDDVTLNSGESRINSNVNVKVLTINNSALVNMIGHHTLKVTGLSMDVANGARIDLQGSCMIVDYNLTSPSAMIDSLVHSSIGGGTGDQPGIGSSTGAPFGYFTVWLDNAYFHYTGFGDYAVDDSSILIAPAVQGDVNMDGIINSVDSTLLFNEITNPTGHFFADLNYDGILTGDDMAIQDANFGLTGPTCVAVPEPSLGLLLAPLALLLRRRPRRSNSKKSGKAVAPVAISAALGAIALGAGTASASQNFTVDITADNAYSIYSGDINTIDTFIGNAYNFDSASQIFSPEHYSSTLPDNAYIYIAAWGDNNGKQGLLADFHNTTQNTHLLSGDSRWEVYPTGQDLNVNDPYPAVDGNLQLQVDSANAFNGWVPVSSSAATNAQGGIYNQTVSGVSGDARWMWYNSGLNGGNVFNGFDHGEYLLFRTPVIVPEPSLGILPAGLLAGAVLRRRSRKCLSSTARA